MSEMNIYQRLNAVMKEVTYVQKDREVTGGGQNYKAVTHDKVVSVVRAALVNAGIAVVPEQLDGSLLIQRDPKADVKMHLYSGSYVIHFVNIDKPDERVSVPVQAHANDNGDKAPGKALTYATKAAILKALMLETGEDEESRAGSSGIDVDAESLAIDACNSLEALRELRKSLAVKCEKAKDAEAWRELKAKTEVRAEELKP